MKMVESTFMLFLITIVGAFVEPPLLEPSNPSSLFNPLYTKNVDLRVANKTFEKVSSVLYSSPVESSHRKFLEYPRSHYVDKTLFIRDVLEFYFRVPGFMNHPVIIVTRPRGFGKTMALSSLYYFCDYTFKNATALFSGLKILERDPLLDDIREKYMSKFPVIWIDFATVKYETFEQNIKEIKRIISNIFRAHQYLLKGAKMLQFSSYRDEFQRLLLGEAEEHEATHSIQLLCECINDYNKRNYNKPIILIDNYDVPFHTGYKSNYFEKMEDFMWAFYSGAMGGRDAHKFILTGVTQIGENNVGWKGPTLENVFAHIVLDSPFSAHFGFTSEEVHGLLKRSRSDLPFQTLNDRYGDYSCGNVSVFNSLSIVNEIFSHKSYQWAETESTESLGKLIVEHGFYPLLTIQQLLAGEHVEKELAVDVNFFKIKKIELNYWSCLAHLGYVTAIKAPGKGKPFGLLRIPNLEVRKRIESLIKEYSKTIPLYKDFTGLLINGKYTEATVFILEYIQKAGEYLREEGRDYDEHSLHEYVEQMLRGVETRYNTTMEITEKHNTVTMKIEDKKGKREPVKVTIQKVHTSDKSRSRLKSEICSLFQPVEKRKAEIIIMVEGKVLDVCVNYFLKNVL